MSTKKKRMVLPDVLKGLAVVLMIHAHVLEQLVNPIMFESVPGKIALYISVFPGAAVFMMVMGYFIGFTSASSKLIVKRGLLLFLGGIALNILLNISYIIRFVQSGYPELIPSAIFGVDILLFAGLSLILIGGIKKLSRNPFLWIVLSLLIVGSTPYINRLIDSWESIKYTTAFIGGTSKWSYFPLFPWLAYPLIGVGAYHIGFDKWNGLKPAVKLIIGFVLIVFSVVGYPMAFNTATDLSVHYHHGILYFLWSLVFVLLLILLLSLMKLESNPLRSAFLSFVGREVTAVYVIQWILIGNIAAWIGKKTLFIGHLAWTIAFIIVSVLLAYVYRRQIAKN